MVTVPPGYPITSIVRGWARDKHLQRTGTDWPGGVSSWTFVNARGAVELGAQQADIDNLGVAAAEAVAQSILSAVRLAKILGGVPGLAG